MAGIRVVIDILKLRLRVMRDLLTLTAVAGDLDFFEDKLPTLDCLAACRIDLTWLLIAYSVNIS